MTSLLDPSPGTVRVKECESKEKWNDASSWQDGLQIEILHST
jgi:hypothetical protein